MYQIVCDGNILHDSRIDDLKVINPVCELEINKTGSLSFKIAPTHPHYDSIHKHTSEITLFQDDEILFVGRVLNDEVDFYNVKNVECEGVLSYLLDSIQRGKVYQLGETPNVIKTYLEDVIAIHNSQVDDRKKFEVGFVNITDPNNFLYKVSNYTNTLSTLTDDLLETYGGRLQIRFDGDKRYIDYLTYTASVCNQKIEFGKNIVDMTRYIKGENIYTALIPLGATRESDVAMNSSTLTYDKRLTISSIPNQTNGSIVKVSDYIYDADAVARWGWIWNVKMWDDVTLESNLFQKATDDLKNSINDNLTLELDALDLHLLDVDVDKISVGDMIQCISAPHNINTILTVKSMSITIDDPSTTSIKLVSLEGNSVIKTDASITTGNKDNEKNIEYVKETMNGSYPTYGEVNQLLDGFKNDLRNDFVSKDNMGVDLSDYAKIADVNDAFDVLANALMGV